MMTKFTGLDSDVACECKTIKDPVDCTGFFHNHDGYEILLLLEGDLDVYTESGGKSLERGDLVCFCEYDFHRASLRSRKIYDRIVINVKDSALTAASSERMKLKDCFYGHKQVPLNVVRLNESEIAEFSAFAHALERCLDSDRPGDEILADAYLKLLMVMVNRKILSGATWQYREIMPEIVSQTFCYIEKHLTEEITLKKLEEYIHHNGTYISRCFKNITGISLQQFIIAKRVTLACRLLQQGYSPSDVCFQAGFNNYSNFSRTFSKQMGGLSPKQYQIQKR